MRSAAKIAAVALLLATISGCSRKESRAAVPPAADAPAVSPTKMANQIPSMPPQLPTAADRPVKLDTAPPPEVAATPPRPPSHHLPHKRPKPASQETAQQETPKAQTPAATPPPTATPSQTQVASGQQPSEMSPIGQISTANDSANTADLHALNDSINSVENGVNAIRRPLTEEEQKTLTQIRTFITRAREALKADDLDGAKTLSTKAHLLLEELTKE